MDGGYNNYKMKIIFLAYRQWSLDVYPSIKKHPKVHGSVLCRTHEELLSLDLSYYDLIISCGWSEELGEEVTSKVEAIGVHCAELDRYSYGSPLQLQIIDGVNRTKHRVFSFTFDNSSKRAHTHNRLFSHEVDLDLSGNMSDVLLQMTSTSIVLFNRYLDDHPDISWQEWPEERIVRPKRSPIESRLKKEDVLKLNTEELYNFFRSLEDPYPNGYIEDERGKLYIKHVEFKKNE